MKVKEEHKEQICFIDYFRKNYPDLLIFRIPNDAKRTITNGYLSKRLGTVAGVPDVFIPVFRLFIEFKTEKGSLSKSQKEVIAKLLKIGYGVEVCKSSAEAIEKVETLIKKQ